MLASFILGALLSLPSLALQDFGNLPGKGGATSFIDFSAEVDRAGTSVVIGTLPKVTEGKRDRMKESEGQLGEAGTAVSMAGTMFYKVASTAKLTVTRPLQGTKEQSVQVGFDMQWTKLPSGEVKRHFLLTPRVQLDDGMQALFVLEKDKSGTRVVQVLRADPKNETGEAFQARAEDVWAINRWMWHLRSALDIAKAAQERDKKNAVETLKKALAAKPKLQAEKSDALLMMHAGPSENRVRELLKELQAEPAREPASEPARKGEPGK